MGSRPAISSCSIRATFRPARREKCNGQRPQPPRPTIALSEDDLLLRSPWDMLHFACSTEHFPLTLTLSLREREQQASNWCLADGRWATSAAGAIESRWTILPLSRGSRGEGKPSVALPTLHSVFDRRRIARQPRML